MKTLVFAASSISGKEPETTNALALLSTLVKNNLEIDGLNPLRVVFGMIKPGEHQTVRSLVVPYLKEVFDDWGKPMEKPIVFTRRIKGPMKSTTYSTSTIRIRVKKK